MITKLLFKYLIVFALLMSLSTCKKYNEGGIIRLARKHLFGERKTNASKTWKLSLYEVNGIDSTHLISGINQIPNFHDQFITFTLDNEQGYSYKAKTFIFEHYSGYIGSNYDEIGISTNKTKIDSIDNQQCIIKNNIKYCSRNILLPEGFKSNSIWKILRLKKDEFVIENTNLKNKYKIKFSQ